MEKLAPNPPLESVRTSLTRPAQRAEPIVQVVLCLVVAALLLLVIAIPIVRRTSSDAAGQQAIAQMRSALDELRGAIGEYRYQHGVWPASTAIHGASPAQDIATLFERQLTLPTNAAGEVATSPTDSHPFGPYLAPRLPANPLNGLSSVRILSASEAWPIEPDDRTGWLYRPATGELRSNSSRDALHRATRSAGE